jgi:hypothetical protein
VTAQAAGNNFQDEAEKAAALERTKTLAESGQAKALRLELTELLKHEDGGKDSSQKPRRSLRQTLFHSSVIRNILWWKRFSLRRDRQHCWR